MEKNMKNIIASYGEMMVRHAVHDVPDFNGIGDNLEAYQVEDCYGGSEGNVLLALASLGLPTRYATCFPVNNSYSEKAIELFNQAGIDTSFIGRSGHKFGEYDFLLDSNLPRGERTRFRRVGSAINHWDLSDFDFNHFFQDVAIFHFSGIALSLDKDGKATDNAFCFIKEARKRDVLVSFDVNYHPSIWLPRAQGDVEKALALAKKAFEPAFKVADLIFLSDRDIAFLPTEIFGRFYDEKTQKILDKDGFAKIFFETYPDCHYLMIRNRNKPKVDENNVALDFYTRDGKNAHRAQESFKVEEAVGGGDVFDAAILYRLVTQGEKELNQTLDFAALAFEDKHLIPGDTFHTLTSEDILAGLRKKKNPTSFPKLQIYVDKLDPDFQAMKLRLSHYAQVELIVGDPVSLKGVDIMVGKRLNEEVLATADRLKAIFAYKTGVDDFPSKALFEKGIALYNSHVDATPIAQYAFALALTLVTRINEFDELMKEGIWYDHDRPYWRSLFNMKVGLLGYGRIGQAINSILLDNHIKTYTIQTKGHDASYYQKTNALPDLDALLRECDLIIASLPKTPETDDLFNQATLAKMKGKYLVNVGRGNCINEKDLYEALKTHQLAGAALDTWNQKAKDNGEKFFASPYPFQDLHNVITSPHRASFTEEGHSRYVKDATENVIEYLQTGSSPNLVDLKKGY